MSAQDLDDELQAVADAQNGDVVGAGVVKESVGEGGGADLVDGVGPAREDEERGVVGLDGGQRGGAGQAHGAHG